MREFGPFIGFIILLILSTLFSKKAEEAQKKQEKKSGQGSTPRQRPTARQMPRMEPGTGPTMDVPSYEDIPFESVDIGAGRSATLDSDDLAWAMLQDNAHLAKHLAELDRWNRHSR